MYTEYRVAVDVGGTFTDLIAMDSRRRGEGIHHLGFFVKDIEKELDRLKKEGIKVLERGEVLGVAKFAYLDTEKALGFILELIQF